MWFPHKNLPEQVIPKPPLTGNCPHYRQETRP